MLGVCISIAFLKTTSDFREDMCVCRVETGKTEDKIKKASPDCGEGEMRITRIVVGYSFNSWFLLKFCSSQSSMAAKLKVSLLMECPEIGTEL